MPGMTALDMVDPLEFDPDMLLDLGASKRLSYRSDPVCDEPGWSRIIIATGRRNAIMPNAYALDPRGC